MEYIVNKIYNSITYILPVGDTLECWLIDCGDVEKIIEQGWRVRGVLLTHAHFDHIYGLNRLVEVFPDAMVYTNESGLEGLLNPKWNLSKYHAEVDNFVFSRPENVILFETEGWHTLEDGFKVDVLFSPGHEPSCLSYHIDNMLFTGDAFIPGVETSQKFPRSNKQLAQISLNRLQTLEKTGLRIVSGHCFIQTS